MSQPRHFAAAFVIFIVIASLFSIIWGGVKEGYNVQETENIEGSNVIERLSQLPFIQEITAFTNNIYQITAPTNVFDLLGSLASAGVGVLKIIGAIVTFPGDIITIITGHYPNALPGIVYTLIGLLTSIYFAFVLLSAYIKWRV